MREEKNNNNKLTECKLAGLLQKNERMEAMRGRTFYIHFIFIFPTEYGKYYFIKIITESEARNSRPEIDYIIFPSKNRIFRIELWLAVAPNTYEEIPYIHIKAARAIAAAKK